MYFAHGDAHLQLRIFVCTSHFGRFRDGAILSVAATVLPVTLMLVSAINMFSFFFSTLFFELYLPIQSAYYALEMVSLLLLCVGNHDGYCPLNAGPTTPAAC